MAQSSHNFWVVTHVASRHNVLEMRGALGTALCGRRHEGAIFDSFDEFHHKKCAVKHYVINEPVMGRALQKHAIGKNPQITSKQRDRWSLWGYEGKLIELSCLLNLCTYQCNAGGGGGRAWGGDLIVFVVPGVGHLTDVVLPGDCLLYTSPSPRD